MTICLVCLRPANGKLYRMVYPVGDTPQIATQGYEFYLCDEHFYTLRYTTDSLDMEFSPYPIEVTT